MTKILICDESAEVGKTCESEFQAMGMQVEMYCQSKGTILEVIWDERPDVVLMDIDAFDAEAMTVMHRAEAMSAPPAFIMTSSVEDVANKKEMMENGAACFMVKPFGILSLYHQVERIIAEKRIRQNSELEMALTDLLHQLGFPANIKGYNYLRTAIQLAVADRTILNHMMKRLYPMVAAKYHTTAPRVERTMRHAIELAWCRGDTDVIQMIFSYTVDDNKAKPTNSEFIALMADKMRLEFLGKNRRC